MKRIFLLPILAIIVLASCGEGEKTEEETNNTSPKEEPQTTTSSTLETISLKKQMEVINLNENQIPKTVSFKGNFVAARQWVDTKGTNLVILSETGIEQDGDISKGSIHAAQFLNSGDGYGTSWNITDAINNCEFDAFCEHLEGSLTVTDLDSNGMAETAFIYRKTCTSDVSPMDQTLVLYENGNAMKLMGTTGLDMGEGMKEEGTMEADEALKTAAPQFLVHAQQLWERFKWLKFN